MYIQSRFFMSKSAMKNLTISIFLTLFAVMFILVSLAHPASANSVNKAGDNFVWKESYGRGVGTIPPMHCGGSRDKVGALCYNKCKQGWAVNPINKLRCKPPGVASYDRGIGITPKSVTKCTNSRDKVGAYCYDKCKQGYEVNSDNKLRCKPPGVAYYDRGAGKLGKCKGNREKVVGLCYEKPRDGYSCKVTMCTRNTKAYDRKPFKTVTNKYCKSNRKLQAGLCYEKPREGYSCNATVCSRIKKGYDRKPFALKSFCKDDKTLNEGLCYKKCRDGFNGRGPVCWSKLPHKWINCGAGGMATSIIFPEFMQTKNKVKTKKQRDNATAKADNKKNKNQRDHLKKKRKKRHEKKEKNKGITAKNNCAIIIATQTAAPLTLAVAACEVAENPGCGAFDKATQTALALKYEDEGEFVLTQGEVIANTVLDAFIALAKLVGPGEKAADVAEGVGSTMNRINTVWKNLSAFQRMMLVKNAGSGASNIASISYRFHDKPDGKSLSPSEQLATIREVANLLQVYFAVKNILYPDPIAEPMRNLASASLGMVSAYLYPHRGQE